MSAVPQPDESTLEGFGYRQELRRVLRTFAVFAVAFSICAVNTASAWRAANWRPVSDDPACTNTGRPCGPRGTFNGPVTW